LGGFLKQALKACRTCRILFQMVLGGVAATVLGDEVVLTPSADTTLIEVAPNNNLGGQNYFNSGTTQNGTRNRGLLQFDLSQIPQNAAISSVDLYLEVVHVPSCGNAPSDFGLHPVLAPWGEGNKSTTLSPGQGAPATAGEATWNDRFALMAQPWSVPGGAPGVDYAAAASSDQYIYGPDQYQFASRPQLVADVQGWLNNPKSNFGWMLITESEDTRFTARRFGSREDPNNAPLLDVQYVLVPEPRTFMLWGAGALLAIGGAKLRKRETARKRGSAAVPKCNYSGGRLNR